MGWRKEDKLASNAREVLGNILNQCNGCQTCSSACSLLADLGNMSLPEIAGDAALLINPDDVDGLAHAMQRALEDEALRTQMRQRGLANAARFSWEKTARETLDIYRRIIE